MFVAKGSLLEITRKNCTVAGWAQGKLRPAPVGSIIVCLMDFEYVRDGSSANRMVVLFESEVLSILLFSYEFRVI